MPSFTEKFGPWAIVAGSAEGLGRAYSVALAKRKLNLFMVDKEEEPLRKLASELRSKFAVQTKTLHLNLSFKDAAKQIMDASADLDTRLLIHNAAFNIIKPFNDVTSEELEMFLEVNVRSQIHLVHTFTGRLIAGKQSGGVLLMSSLAGLIGMQLVASYAASKAFTWNLAEALHHELKDHGIDIMACISGATATPAYLKTNPRYGIIKPLVMKPDKVAESALRKLGKKTLYIPGFSNRLNYFILTKLLPRKTAASIANKTMGKMYAGSDNH